MSQATVSTIPIPEIRENEAPQEIALLYEDMRRCMRLPVVNLVYRHMATMPGALHWVWGAVRPALLSGEVDDALDLLKRKLSLTKSAPLNPELLAEFNSADWLAIRRVLDAYNRGNGLNLIVLTTVRLALRRAEPVGPRAVFSREPATDAVLPLPPLLKIGDLDAETASVVRDIALLHGGGPGVVPRHLSAPCALAALSRCCLRPHPSAAPEWDIESDERGGHRARTRCSGTSSASRCANRPAAGTGFGSDYGHSRSLYQSSHPGDAAGRLGNRAAAAALASNTSDGCCFGCDI
jgi:hypothetical protein